MTTAEFIKAMGAKRTRGGDKWGKCRAGNGAQKKEKLKLLFFIAAGLWLRGHATGRITARR
ncbi:MAG: hypothetical protein ACRCYV_00680 [Aeromonas sp.]